MEIGKDVRVDKEERVRYMFGKHGQAGVGGSARFGINLNRQAVNIPKS